ncbi:MAG: hypothetical protein ACREBO_05085 [Novosphingobium sp.]
MSGALFALIACALAGIGARDQLLVAGLAARNGQHLGLLLVAPISSFATAAIAAAVAQAVLPLLATDARQMLAAIALGLAGAEMVLARRAKLGEEPTRSLGAAGIVLFAQQLTDAARFLVFALAVGTGAPLAAGAGGAIGGAAAVAAGWLAGEDLLKLRLTAARRAIGAALLLVAAGLALAVLSR